MSILGPLGWLFGIGVYGAADEILTTRRINKNVADMERRGCFWKNDFCKENTYRDEIDHDWYSGEKAFFPKDLIPFLENDIGARFDYMEGLVNKRLIDEHILPMYVYSQAFDRSQYDPFCKYHKNHAKEEREYYEKLYPGCYAEEDAKKEKIRRKKERDDNILALIGLVGIVAALIFIISLFF